MDLFRCEESGRIVEKSFVRAKFEVKIIWQRGNESARLKSETSLVSEKSSLWLSVDTSRDASRVRKFVSVRIFS